MRVVEPIEVDLDKKRHLLLTLGGLKRAQIELNKARGTSKSVYRVISEEMSKFDSGDLFGEDFCEAILWAALLHEDKSLTLDQVGDLPWNLREIPQLIVRLIMETYIKIQKDDSEVIEVPDGDEKKNQMRLNGTASSGASPESN